jgi:hypothetical protein
MCVVLSVSLPRDEGASIRVIDVRAPARARVGQNEEGVKVSHRFRAVATLAAVAAAAVPAIAAASTTSHAKVWQNTARTVTCGIAIHAPGKPATRVLCQGIGIPMPKGRGVGDPAVQIGKKGRPQLIRISQCSWSSCSKIATLRTGARWSALGVRCTVVNKLVTCQNQSRHGFATGHGRYRSF